MKKMHHYNSEVKISNAAENFKRKYGKAAYEAWLRRDAEITALSKGHEYSRTVICWMREKSFRQMKEDGARWATAQKTTALPPAKIDHAA